MPDGPWPAAKLMKKLVSLGPDAWNSEKCTGDDWGLWDAWIFLWSCDTESDTVSFSMCRISKMLDIELIR